LCSYTVFEMEIFNISTTCFLHQNPDGTMSNVNVWFGQEGRSANFNVCGGDYVKNMGYSLNGIVFIASLWGGGGIDMGWLDGMTGCGGECNLSAASVTFSNFALKPI
jgi:hypothetical protein